MIARELRRGGVAVKALLVAAIAGCTVAFGAAPAEADASAADFAAIDQFITEQMKENAIPGVAVAITVGDHAVHVAGYGHDSLGVDVSDETLFQIASLSKSFTALAVLQLADQGLLSLDDTVQSRLPEFRLADPRGSQITIRHVLTQTSGLADSTSPDMSRPRPDSLTEAVAGLRTVHLAAAPGAQWNYHNPNYEIAARLVEFVSGEPFGQYVDRHIFEPAGMSSSTTETFDNEPIPRLARGHIVAFGTPVATDALGLFVAGSGDVVTNASDMATWLMINANGGVAPNGTRLVSEEGFADWHRPGASNGYALGWDTDGSPSSPTRLDHTGNQFTFEAAQVVLPKERLGLAIMFNSSSAFSSAQVAMVEGVLALVAGKSLDPRGSSVPPWLSDLPLVLVSVLALALGAIGVARSGRWVLKYGQTRIRLVFSALPLLLLIAMVSMLPALTSFIYGREVTWGAALYGWPALVIAALSVASSCAATLVIRAVRLANAKRPRIGGESPTD